jgi:hypothetical protein
MLLFFIVLNSSYWFAGGLVCLSRPPTPSLGADEPELPEEDFKKEEEEEEVLTASRTASSNISHQFYLIRICHMEQFVLCVIRVNM